MVRPADMPVIDVYTDFRRYLKDALVAAGRSQRDLASALKVSPALLTQIMKRKRRMRATLVDPVADYFELDGDERLMLSALIDLDNESERARRSAWATIRARQRYLAERRASDEDVVQVIAVWWVAAVYELSSCDGFRADPTWIAHTLNPPISITQAEEALQTLLRLGMLEPDDDGQLRAADKQYWTEMNVPRGRQSEALAALQREINLLATDSLERFRANERHCTQMTFAASDEQFRAIIVRLREMEREILHMAINNHSAEPATRVMSLSTALFPLSDYTDVEYDPSEVD